MDSVPNEPRDEMPDTQLRSVASNCFPRFGSAGVLVVQQLNMASILDPEVCETRVWRKKAVGGNKKVSLQRRRFMYISRVKKERRKEELEGGLDFRFR